MYHGHGPTTSAARSARACGAGTCSWRRSPGLPPPTHQKIDEAGAAILVDKTAAEFLDDKILDAFVEAQGVRFTIRNPRSRALGQTDRLT